jgi:hypothetical protein
MSPISMLQMLKHTYYDYLSMVVLLSVVTNFSPRLSCAQPCISNICSRHKRNRDVIVASLWQRHRLQSRPAGALSPHAGHEDQGVTNGAMLQVRKDLHAIFYPTAYDVARMPGLNDPKQNPWVVRCPASTEARK